MRTPDARGGDDAADDDVTDGRPVTVHESCPGRVVFTEDGNPDGWISTDLTVDLDD
jgi:hypothetical protein